MKTSKRIVSKTEYARIETLRFVLLFSASFFRKLAYISVWMMVSSLLLVVLIIVIAIQCKLQGKPPVVQHDDFSVPRYVLLTILSTLFFCALSYASNAKVKSLGIVVPFTRANTADLPAPDSLVRASQEPVQQDQSILLRAAADTTQTPAEQLLRPVPETITNGVK